MSLLSFLPIIIYDLTLLFFFTLDLIFFIISCYNNHQLFIILISFVYHIILSDDILIIFYIPRFLKQTKNKMLLGFQNIFINFKFLLAFFYIIS